VIGLALKVALAPARMGVRLAMDLTFGKADPFPHSYDPACLVPRTAPPVTIPVYLDGRLIAEACSQ
jgi:hypothetical protein